MLFLYLPAYTPYQLMQYIIYIIYRRYDPQFRAVYDQVRAGVIGQLRVIKTTSRDPPEIADPNYVKGTCKYHCDGFEEILSIII